MANNVMNGLCENKYINYIIKRKSMISNNALGQW